jgi:hypothetical protein
LADFNLSGHTPRVSTAPQSSCRCLVPWWPSSQPLLSLHAPTFPRHTRHSLWPRRRGFGARLALRAPFVHTLRTAHASQGGHHLARMGDGNQRAVSTCRTGGAPFIPNMTKTEACRVAPRLRQYLVCGIGFWFRTGTARRSFWRKTHNACVFHPRLVGLSSLSRDPPKEDVLLCSPI